MIAFLPVVRLRDLGKQRELRKFTETTGELSSVEKLIAGVFYRFSVDTMCPAIFVQLPQEGDTPFSRIQYVVDITIDDLKSLAQRMFEAGANDFGTNKITWYPISDTIYLLMKNDFKEGDWENYGYEYSGKDGISIPTE